MRVTSASEARSRLAVTVAALDVPLSSMAAGVNNRVATGVSSSSVMSKVGAPDPDAPTSRLTGTSVPRPRLTVSAVPSSVVSSVAVRVRVALLAAPAMPEKAMVGGLVEWSVLARFE